MSRGRARARDRHRWRDGGRRARREHPAVTEVDPIIIAVVVLAIVIFVIVVIVRSIRIIPQAYAGVVERLGRYHKTLIPGLNILVPFIDRLRPLVDMRETVVSFPPQPVITEDNLVVSIDTVVYFQVTDAGRRPTRSPTTSARSSSSPPRRSATSSAASTSKRPSPPATTSTASCASCSTRRRASGASASPASSSRRSTRPTPSRTRWRSRCAPSVTAAPLILTAEGHEAVRDPHGRGPAAGRDPQGRGRRQGRGPARQGEAEAIQTVFDAIHKGDPDPKLLAYQYLQTLPQIAEGRQQAVDHPERSSPRRSRASARRSRRSGPATDARRRRPDGCAASRPA